MYLQNILLSYPNSTLLKNYGNFQKYKLPKYNFKHNSQTSVPVFSPPLPFQNMFVQLPETKEYIAVYFYTGSNNF